MLIDFHHLKALASRKISLLAFFAINGLQYLRHFNIEYYYNVARSQLSFNAFLIILPFTLLLFFFFENI